MRRSWGTIKKRTRKGRTFFEVGSAKDAEGKRAWQTADTRAEAEAILQQMRQAASRGRQIRSSITLYELWASELDLIAESGSFDTWSLYKMIGVKYFEPVIPDKPLNQVVAGDIQRVISMARAKGKSASTLDVIYRTANRMFNRAVKLRHITRDENPMEGVVRPKLPRHSGNVLTWNQLDQVVASAPHDKAKAMILIAAETGARSGELRALRWMDIVTEGPMPAVLITRQAKYIKPSKDDPGRWEFPEPKAHSRRAFPLVEGAADRILDALAAIKPPNAKPADLIFAQPNGSPLHKRTVWGWLRKAIEAANAKDAEKAAKEGREPQVIPYLKFHELRSTMVTRYQTSGAALASTAKLVGHRSTRTTEQHYIKLVDLDMVDAVAKVRPRNSSHSEKKTV